MWNVLNTGSRPHPRMEDTGRPWECWCSTILEIRILWNSWLVWGKDTFEEAKLLSEKTPLKKLNFRVKKQTKKQCYETIGFWWGKDIFKKLAFRWRKLKLKIVDTALKGKKKKKPHWFPIEFRSWVSQVRAVCLAPEAHTPKSKNTRDAAVGAGTLWHLTMFRTSP